PELGDGEHALVEDSSGEDPIAAAAARFEQALQESGTPGAAVALLLNGRRVFTRAFGVRNSQSEQPVTADKLIRTHSLIKPLLALAVMRLVEQGKLSLDEPIARQLPYFGRAAGHSAGAVTLEQLLAHTAGIPDSGVAPCSSSDESIVEYFTSRANDPLWNPPGWFYNY